MRGWHRRECVDEWVIFGQYCNALYKFSPLSIYHLDSTLNITWGYLMCLSQSVDFPFWGISANDQGSGTCSPLWVTHAFFVWGGVLWSQSFSRSPALLKPWLARDDVTNAILKSLFFQLAFSRTNSIHSPIQNIYWIALCVHIKYKCWEILNELLLLILKYSKLIHCPRLP